MKEQRKRLSEYQPVSQLLEVMFLLLKLSEDNSKLFLIFQSFYYKYSFKKLAYLL